MSEDGAMTPSEVKQACRRLMAACDEVEKELADAHRYSKSIAIYCYQAHCGSRYRRLLLDLQYEIPRARKYILSEREEMRRETEKAK